MRELDLLATVKEHFNESGDNPNNYSPLTLAFIGDSIYGLIVKTVVTLRGNCPANLLNSKSVKYVKASAQAKVADYLSEQNMLSEEEENILRRGRNAKSATKAKNASTGDYRKATGLEALVGYLYLMGRQDRMIELLKIGMDAIEEE